MENEKPIEELRAALAEGARCIVVTGAAGTGKTTFIRDIIPILSGMRYDVRLVAPTGCAAKMMQIRTDCAASTIHSAIFKVDDKPVAGNGDNGDLRWIFPLKTDRPVRTAFIVDESSMVGSALHNDGILQFGTGSLLRDLLTYSGIERPDSDNLVVFVGDPYQLPPVGEKTSSPPALDVEYLGALARQDIPEIRLSKICRQREDSGILKEASRIRASIAYGIFSVYRSMEYEDVRRVDDSRFEETYRPESGLDGKIVIAYTNASVWDYNCRIRRILGFRTALPGSGERLLSLRNTVVAGTEGGEHAFMNGDMLQVINVDSSRVVELEGFYRPKGGTDTLHFTFSFVKMTLAWLYDDGRTDADVWVNVTPVLSGAYRENADFASVALYVAVAKKIRERFGLGTGPEDERELREHLKDSKLYHAPVVTFGYAITGHKAQGGEWKEVWIDYRYTQNKMSEGYFRWMYTAATRARDVVYAISPPMFDDIADALSRRMEKMSESTDAGRPAGSGATLEEILSRHGFVAVETARKAFSVRLTLAKKDDPLVDAGWLDLNFNGKDIVSYVKMQCPCASDEMGADIAALKGRNIKIVLAEAGKNMMPEARVVETVESHNSICDRLCAAAVNAGMGVTAVKSLTQNQLRLGLSSDLGDGYVDFYIDAKGRVTEIGSATVSRKGLERLREGLAG